MYHKGLVELTRGFDVAYEALFLPGQVSLAPVVVKAGFSDGANTRIPANRDDFIHVAFTAIFVLRMQRPGSEQKPRRHVQNGEKILFLTVIAGNDERTFESCLAHAGNHLGAVGIELAGVDV